MGEYTYPLFVPPPDVATEPHRDWSKAAAQSYFDWLLGCAPERVDRLLRHVGIAERAPRDRQLLIDVGGRVAQFLPLEEFSLTASDGSPHLTNAGSAMAADMGLLTAEALLRVAGASVRWEILRKPKSDMSYNMPVLAGFGMDVLDPIVGSLAVATGILAGRRGPDEWARSLDYWAAEAKAKANAPTRSGLPPRS